jgi:hypothetical protein
MKFVIKGKSKLMSEPASEREPEPKLFESRSGNEKFRLHNTVCDTVDSVLFLIVYTTLSPSALSENY